MLAIRLSRVGKKKYATFRLVVSEKTKDTVGDYLELLGSYNPHTNDVDLKADRIKHWISKGAKPSGSVHNLLVEHKIIEGQKVKVANIKKKQGDESKEEGAGAKPATAEQKPAESKKEEAPAEKPKEETAEAPKQSEEKKEDTTQEGKK